MSDTIDRQMAIDMVLDRMERGKTWAKCKARRDYVDIGETAIRTEVDTVQ